MYPIHYVLIKSLVILCLSTVFITCLVMSELLSVVSVDCQQNFIVIHAPI